MDDEAWAWEQRGYVTWELAVIVVVKRSGTLSVLTAGVRTDEGEESSLLVFRNHTEAQAYREDTKRVAGHGIVGVEDSRIAGLLGRYGLRWVAMADSWDEDDNLRVDQYEADRFIALLERGFRA